MKRNAAVVVGLLILSLAALPAAATPPPNNPDDGKEAGQGIEFNQSSGPAVEVGQRMNFTNTNPWSQSNNITLDPWGTFHSNGNTHVRVDRWNGTWTNLSDLDVTSADLVVDINDKRPIAIGGDAETVNISDSIAVGDGQTDFRINGTGTGDVTVYQLTANSDFAAVDADSGNLLDAAQSDSNGRLDLSMSLSSHNVKIQSYNPSAPDIDNSSLSPTGDSVESDPQAVDLSVDINDSDFPNDSVTVDFNVEGSTVATDTISSNGTARATVSEPIAGNYSWSVNATDDFDVSQVSDQSYFLIANELRVFNESDPTNLTDNVTVQLQFFAGVNQTIEDTRTTDTGTINMSGLPATQPLIVTVQADGYVNRRMFIRSLTERQDIYTLPVGVQSVKPTFKLRDFTGDFPKDETVMIIQRPLNGSWENVAGDFYGATGEFPATLAFNERHRIILLNVRDGTERQQGPYTPQTSTEQTITVRPDREININQFEPTVQVSPGTRTLSADNSSIEAFLDDQDQSIDSWNVTVVRVDNGTNTTLMVQSYDGNDSNQEKDLSMNLSGYAGDDVVVRVNWSTADGRTGKTAVSYDVAQSYDNSNSLLSVLGSVGTLIPDSNLSGFQTITATFLSIIMTTAIASKLRLSSESVGLTGLGFIAGFSVIGFIPYGVMFACVAAFAAFAALRRGL